MSNRFRVTAGFVETDANTPPKKGKKWTKTQIYSLTSSLFSESIHLTFSCLKYCLFGTKHASIYSTHFLMVVSLFLWNATKDHLVSWIIWTSVLKFQPRSLHFNDGNNQNLENLFQQSDFHFLVCMVTYIIWKHTLFSRARNTCIFLNCEWSRHLFS